MVDSFYRRESPRVHARHALTVILPFTLSSQTHCSFEDSEHRPLPKMSPALDYFSKTSAAAESIPEPAMEDVPTKSIHTDASGNYYNPRLDPKNYLEGPLSDNPATRLRQMLARPGIVVRTLHSEKLFAKSLMLSLLPY
ncbi:hypothetical protein EYR38_001323 [Pleurotus pulmonarius]|nr:hypothetical protein EYR38_001323 [Pleurotus pulmonarius]